MPCGARCARPTTTWSGPRLILATETDLSAQAVVEVYAQRWGIEPLFHNLKRWWGVVNLWQQSKVELELWMQIRCTAYALTQLLVLRLWESSPLMDIAPRAQGGDDHGGVVRVMAAHSNYRTSRAPGLRPEAGSIRDAVSWRGSAFAVLRRVPSHAPASNRSAVPFVIARYREFSVGGWRGVSKLQSPKITNTISLQHWGSPWITSGI